MTELNLKKIRSTPEEQSESLGTARGFFLVITILLSYISLVEIFGGESRLVGGRLAAYLALLVVHITLHWLSVYFLEAWGVKIPYVLVQAALGVGLSMVADSSTISLLVFSSLVAEVIGLFGIGLLTWVSIFLLIGIALFNIFLIGGMDLLSAMWGPSLWTFALLIVFMVMFRQQLESRERSQELLGELEMAYEQLSRSSAQIEELTLTSERQRLARELHDSLAQDLSGLVLQLEGIKHLVGIGKTDKVEEIIDQAMLKSRKTLADTRRAIDDLHLEVEAPSIREVFENKANQFSSLHGIPIRLQLAIPELASIPFQIRENANRIFDEALTNVAKHANASEVRISVIQKENQFIIEIEDDGRGFDPMDETPSGHYGLQGMRERAELLGGNFEVGSQSGKGSRIKVSLPLTEPV